MQKLINAGFNDEEYFLLNNLLVEHCMSMVDLVNGQESREGANKAMELLKASVGTQQYLFTAAVKKENELPESMVFLFRPLVESALETLVEVKSGALESGDLSAFRFTETEDALKSILNKIPEPSRIIV